MTEPGIVVLTGPPCSGKSAVLRALAVDRSIRHRTCLEVDAVFALLTPGSNRNRNDRMLAYDAAHVIASMLVERGNTVILECAYARTEQRVSLNEALTSAPASPLWIIEFHVSGDEAVKRFRLRDEGSDLDENSLRERVDNFPYWDEAYPVKSFSAKPAALADCIDAWLGEIPTSHDRTAWVESGRAWS